MQIDLVYYLTATMLGGFHALEPGHGKTVVAAYLIGSRGRKIDAVVLGLVVTLTHTLSVILLAIAAKVASTRITLTEESLHGYLGLVAGLMILAVGIWMLVQRIRGKEPFHFHSHDHGQGHSHSHDSFHSHSHAHNHNHEDNNNDHYHEPHDVETHNNFHVHSHGHSHDHDSSEGHSHSHDHDHTHEGDHHDHGEHDPDTYDNPHTHNHLHDHEDDLPCAGGHELSHNHNDPHSVDVREGKRESFWQLFLLGVSGGLVPCPAAIAILLAAVGTGRLEEGLTYILLFSLGLAAVLIAIGIAVVSAGNFATRFLNAKRFAGKIAIGSAALVTFIGGLTLISSIRYLI